MKLEEVIKILGKSNLDEDDLVIYKKSTGGKFYIQPIYRNADEKWVGNIFDRRGHCLRVEIAVKNIQ